MRSIRQHLVTIGIAGLSALLPAASSLVISEGGSLARPAAATVAASTVTWSFAPNHTRWSFSPDHTRWSGGSAATPGTTGSA